MRNAGQHSPRPGWTRRARRHRLPACAGLLTATLAGCAGANAAPPTSPALAVRPSPAVLTEPGQIAPIYAAIDAARTSIDMTMYEVEDLAAERALVAAGRRGVTVRVLLNGSGYAATANGGAYAYLRARGVQVRWSPSYFTFTHQKTITIDHRRSLVMTLNLTARYYANTRDFAIWDGRSADVRAIESAFGADWASRRIIPPAGAGDLLWSPGAEGALVALIDRAGRSVDVENEEMADRAIIAALCRAAQRRVRVRIVMTYASSWAGAFSTLGRCGASVHVFHGETPLYIHAKAIVADGLRGYVGSQNFSYTSLERNRELGLMSTSRPLVRSLDRTFGSDFRRARSAAAGPSVTGISRIEGRVPIHRMATVRTSVIGGPP